MCIVCQYLKSIHSSIQSFPAMSNMLNSITNSITHSTFAYLQKTGEGAVFSFHTLKKISAAFPENVLM